MPRNLPGAILFYPIGFALAGGGAIALGWFALAAYDSEQALGVALWAVRHSPVGFDDEKVQDLVRPGSRGVQLAVAAFTVWVGWKMLRGARTALRPVTDSDDGKFSIELKTPQPRLGEKLEGRISIEKAPAAREMFRVTLECRRFYSIGDGPRDQQVMFGDYRDVMAVEDARGWSLPFTFGIPADAPATDTLSWIPSNADVIQWRLEVSRMNALINTGSWFDIQVLEAEPNTWDFGRLFAALDPRTPMNQGKAYVYLLLLVFVVLPILAAVVRSVASLF